MKVGEICYCHSLHVVFGHVLYILGFMSCCCVFTLHVVFSPRGGGLQRGSANREAGGRTRTAVPSLAILRSPGFWKARSCRPETTQGYQHT